MERNKKLLADLLSAALELEIKDEEFKQILIKGLREYIAVTDLDTLKKNHAVGAVFATPEAANMFAVRSRGECIQCGGRMDLKTAKACKTCRFMFHAKCYNDLAVQEREQRERYKREQQQQQQQQQQSLSTSIYSSISAIYSYVAGAGEAQVLHCPSCKLSNGKFIN